MGNEPTRERDSNSLERYGVDNVQTKTEPMYVQKPQDSTSRAQMAEWEYEEHPAKWKKYDDAAQIEIEKAWQAGETDIVIERGMFKKDLYTLNLIMPMYQIHHGTGNVCSVRRFKQSSSPVRFSHFFKTDSSYPVSRDTSQSQIQSSSLSQNVKPSLLPPLPHPPSQVQKRHQSFSQVLPVDASRGGSGSARKIQSLATLPGLSVISSSQDVLRTDLPKGPPPSLPPFTKLMLPCEKVKVSSSPKYPSVHTVENEKENTEKIPYNKISSSDYSTEISDSNFSDTSSGIHIILPRRSRSSPSSLNFRVSDLILPAETPVNSKTNNKETPTVNHGKHRLNTPIQGSRTTEKVMPKKLSKKDGETLENLHRQLWKPTSINFIRLEHDNQPGKFEGFSPEKQEPIQNTKQKSENKSKVGKSRVTIFPLKKRDENLQPENSPPKVRDTRPKVVLMTPEKHDEQNARGDNFTFLSNIPEYSLPKLKIFGESENYLPDTPTKLRKPSLEQGKPSPLLFRPNVPLETISEKQCVESETPRLDSQNGPRKSVCMEPPKTDNTHLEEGIKSNFLLKELESNGTREPLLKDNSATDPEFKKYLKHLMVSISLLEDCSGYYLKLDSNKNNIYTRLLSKCKNDNTLSCPFVIGLLGDTSTGKSCLVDPIVKNLNLRQYALEACKAVTSRNCGYSANISLFVSTPSWASPKTPATSPRSPISDIPTFPNTMATRSLSCSVNSLSVKFPMSPDSPRTPSLPLRSRPHSFLSTPPPVPPFTPPSTNRTLSKSSPVDVTPPSPALVTHHSGDDPPLYLLDTEGSTANGIPHMLKKWLAFQSKKGVLPQSVLQVIEMDLIKRNPAVEELITILAFLVCDLIIFVCTDLDQVRNFIEKCNKIMDIIIPPNHGLLPNFLVVINKLPLEDANWDVASYTSKILDLKISKNGKIVSSGDLLKQWFNSVECLCLPRWEQSTPVAKRASINRWTKRMTVLKDLIKQQALKRTVLRKEKAVQLSEKNFLKLLKIVIEDIPTQKNNGTLRRLYDLEPNIIHRTSMQVHRVHQIFIALIQSINDPHESGRPLIRKFRTMTEFALAYLAANIVLELYGNDYTPLEKNFKVELYSSSVGFRKVWIEAAQQLVSFTVNHRLCASTYVTTPEDGTTSLALPPSTALRCTLTQSEHHEFHSTTTSPLTEPKWTAKFRNLFKKSMVLRWEGDEEERDGSDWRSVSNMLVPVTEDSPYLRRRLMEDFGIYLDVAFGMPSREKLLNHIATLIKTVTNATILKVQDVAMENEIPNPGSRKIRDRTESMPDISSTYQQLIKFPILLEKSTSGIFSFSKMLTNICLICLKLTGKHNSFCSEECLKYWKAAIMDEKWIANKHHPAKNNEITSNMAQCYITCNRYMLLNKLGKGGFGLIYSGIDLDSGLEVAIKLENPTLTKKEYLRHEFSVYQAISTENSRIKFPQNSPHNFPQRERALSPNSPRDLQQFSENLPQIFPQQYMQNFRSPRAFHYGYDGGYHVLVMELLGPSLAELFSFKKKFSIKTVCLLALKMITCVEFFHSHGYIHKDLKPSNFVMGRGKFGTEVFLIDYGLSGKFLDTENNHVPFRTGVGFFGTDKFASKNSHQGIELSRRDDVESLGYVLLYFLEKDLPWSEKKFGTMKKYERRRMWGRLKQQITPSELSRGVPGYFLLYFEHVLGLNFKEIPNYDYLRKLFLDYMTENDIMDDGIFDWMT